MELDEEHALRLARRFVPAAGRVTAVYTDGWRHLAYEIDSWAILKLHKPRAPPGELAREAAVLRYLNHTTDRPVPRLLGFGEDPESGAHICVTRMPGISLERRGRPWPEGAVDAVGRIAADLHALPVEPLVDGGVPPLDIERCWHAGTAYLLERGHASQEQATALNERFARGRARFGEFRLILLHGDLWPTNCFVDEAIGQLNGVIDFGDASIGPPAWRFALPSDLVGLWPRELLSAYARAVPLPQDFGEEVAFYRMVRTVHVPAWVEAWAPEKYWPIVVRNTLEVVGRYLSGS